MNGNRWKAEIARGRADGLRRLVENVSARIATRTMNLLGSRRSKPSKKGEGDKVLRGNRPGQGE